MKGKIMTKQLHDIVQSRYGEQLKRILRPLLAYILDFSDLPPRKRHFAVIKVF